MARLGRSYARSQRVTPRPNPIRQYPASLSDSVGGTDLLTRGYYTGTRVLTEASSGVGVISHTAVYAPRTAGDFATANDGVARSYSTARVPTDIAGGTEVLALSQVLARLLTDTGSGTDNVARAFIGARSTGDVASALDVLARHLVGIRAITDNAVASEIISRNGIFPRSIAESAHAVEGLTRAIVVVRSLSESVNGIDNLTRLFIGTRLLADSAPAVDSELAAKRTYTILIADTALASEGIVRSLIYGRSISGNVGGVDTVTRRFIGVRAVSDILSLSDALTIVRTFVRVPSDSAPAVEGLIRAFTGSRATNDAAIATDVWVRRFTGARIFSDTVGAVEGLSRTTIAKRASSDAAGGTSVVVRGFTGGRTLTQPAGGLDSVVLARLNVRTLSDSAPTFDAAFRTGSTTLFLGELATTADAAQRGLYIGSRGLLEVAPAVDDITLIFFRYPSNVTAITRIALRVFPLLTQGVLRGTLLVPQERLFVQRNPAQATPHELRTTQAITFSATTLVAQAQDSGVTIYQRSRTDVTSKVNKELSLTTGL